MNIFEYDIMNKLFQKSYSNQRELAEDSGYSLGKVNQTIFHLQEEGYLTAPYQLTPKAFQEREGEKSPPGDHSGGRFRNAHDPHQPGNSQGTSGGTQRAIDRAADPPAS